MCGLKSITFNYVNHLLFFFQQLRSKFALNPWYKFRHSGVNSSPVLHGARLRSKRHHPNGIPLNGLKLVQPHRHQRSSTIPLAGILPFFATGTQLNILQCQLKIIPPERIFTVRTFPHWKLNHIELVTSEYFNTYFNFQFNTTSRHLGVIGHSPPSHVKFLPNIAFRELFVLSRETNRSNIIYNKTQSVFKSKYNSASPVTDTSRANLKSAISLYWLVSSLT